MKYIIFIIAILLSSCCTREYVYEITYYNGDTEKLQTCNSTLQLNEKGCLNSESRCGVRKIRWLYYIDKK